MTAEPSEVTDDLDEPGGTGGPLGAVIASRLREFRRRQGWTVGKLAEASGVSKSMLSKIENGQASPSLATLGRLSEALTVPVTAFFRGLSEEQDMVFVKAGSGLDIHHKGAGPGHRYQMLGAMRAPHDTLEPMLVTLTERSEVFPLYQHSGTELIFMISGKMEYCYGDARYLLEPGDAMQFVGEVMHGPGELVALPIQFLAIKSVSPGG
ncbi:MAG: helix-turn-helix domain-containing protein [Streptosporangiales bacterium]|nr:helix-turn-helix domain-containing protein [Streptosporangiales bacterium]MBO0889773.1 helix-turn-helix domain-containing protein [Acidothermales bacterium]